MAEKSAVHFRFEAAGYEDHFKVVSFSGTEGVSQLFRYDLFITGQNIAIDLDALVGKPAVLSISTGDDMRHVSGLISRFWWVGESGDLNAYYAELVPAPWLLWHRTDCRIFQELSVPDIVKKVLDAANIPADMYSLKMLRKNYAARAYCVQYQESDFNFIARLMEEEGIFYFFEHHYDAGKRSGRHVMVLGDDPSCHAAIAGKAKVIFNEPSGTVPTEEYIYEYQFGHQVRSGSVALCDYNYKRPDLGLHATAFAKDFQKLALYHYPGGYDSQPAGSDLAKLRLQELQAQRKIGSGRSNCCRLTPGLFFTLDDHPQKHLNQDYMLLSVGQGGSQRDVPEDSQSDYEKILRQLASYLPLPAIGPVSFFQAVDYLKKGLDYLFGEDKKEYFYSNQFMCIPLSTPFRPVRMTPKPFVRGPQTAKVVAPDDEKVQIDELGRIKVKFYWDRDQKEDYKRTCLIRMASSYAGGDHGIQFPPVAGDEVVVDFIDGDPDKPLITGAVYNALNRPPLKPEQKIENVILTPYQHRLHFNDREKSITLTSGGGEKILMEDGEDTSKFGRMVRISTADDHKVTLAKSSSRSGIGLRTELEHIIELSDSKRRILVQDITGALKIALDSNQKEILLLNQEGQIIIHSEKNRVTVKGGSVEVVGGAVDINGSAEVKITSAAKVEINAPLIEANAAGSIKLAAPHISLEASMIDLNAGNTKASALFTAPVVTATNTIVSPSYTPGVNNLK